VCQQFLSRLEKKSEDICGSPRLGEGFAANGRLFQKGLVPRRQKLEKSPIGCRALQEKADTAAAEATING